MSEESQTDTTYGRRSMTAENPPIDPDRHRMGPTTQLDRIESKLDRVLAALEDDDGN